MTSLTPCLGVAPRMSVVGGKIGLTNRQLGSDRLIPLIAGVLKGLPARLLISNIGHKRMIANPVKKVLDQKQNYLKITNKTNRFVMPKNHHPKFGKCKFVIN